MSNKQHITIEHIEFAEVYQGVTSFIITAQVDGVEQTLEVKAKNLDSIIINNDHCSVEGSEHTNVNENISFSFDLEESYITTQSGELGGVGELGGEIAIANKILSECKDQMIDDLIEYKIEQLVNSFEEY